MELVDIGDLKSPGVKAVQVRVLSPIPNMESYSSLVIRGIPAKDVGGQPCVGSNPTGSFDLHRWKAWVMPYSKYSICGTT